MQLLAANYLKDKQNELTYQKLNNKIKNKKKKKKKKKKNLTREN